METVTRSDFFDIGFGWGCWGEYTTGDMLSTLRRELGTLEPWQVDAAVAGFRQGQKEKAEYEREMAAREPVRLTPADAPY